jgi:hypothetical protein
MWRSEEILPSPPLEKEGIITSKSLLQKWGRIDSPFEKRGMPGDFSPISHFEEERMYNQNTT